MSFEKPDRQYWDDKFAAYLHDPFDKVFRIQGHAQRSGRNISNVLACRCPTTISGKKPMALPLALSAARFPVLVKTRSQNGAVDFIIDQNGHRNHQSPYRQQRALCQLKVQGKTIATVHDELIRFIEGQIGKKPEEKSYANRFRDEHDTFCMARFLYAHLLLRFQLAEKNVAGLGGLWHRLPADTRFPDHSIWQHNALTSALYSTMDLAGDSDNIGLMVFSLTPVQGFIPQRANCVIIGAGRYSSHGWLLRACAGSWKTSAPIMCSIHR
jgi:CRISPR-associated protein Cmr2